MAHLAKNSKIIHPIVIPTNNGKFLTPIQKNENTYFVRLVSYIKGKVFADVKPHSNDMLYEFGEFLGILSQGLSDFSHFEAQRDFYWDLLNASNIINKYKKLIKNQEQRKIIEYFQKKYETKVLPNTTKLRKSIIHSDANNYNIILNMKGNNRTFGIIDFGDMVYSCTIFELAIAIAYAILEKKNPIAAASHIICGYHAKFPITELELELLFLLICARLCMSVSIALYQHQIEPNNKYLVISQKSVWNTLERLQQIHPRFAYFSFRKACKLSPNPKYNELINWFKENENKINPVIGLNKQKYHFAVLDLSIESLELSKQGKSTIRELIVSKMAKENVEICIGKHNEPRLNYINDTFKIISDNGFFWKSIHLGLDLYMKKDTEIIVPYDGKIHSFNKSTIIIEHKINDNLKFFTLYKHILKFQGNISVSKQVNKGDLLGKIRSYKDNLSHLHFQLIFDMFDYQDRFPDVVCPSQREIWRSICPDPNLILQLPDDLFTSQLLSKKEILELREDIIGKSLSIAYTKPLKFVRGFMQYLFDETGRRYLDAVNNVPHVGHSHPKVVKILQQQIAILNTNTRYLHDNLVKYAHQLSETLPGQLNVCFFVNSGSEANELALRLARAYTNKNEYIVLDGAYHGNTGNLINLSPYKFDAPGGSGAPSNVHKVSLPDIYRGKYKQNDPDAGEKYAKEVLEIIDQFKNEKKGISAFIFESLPGCGGQIVLPGNYLKFAFQHIREAGGLCIADEVQVGFGRVGTHFWGFETQNVIPDIVTMGKPIGNGHPLGAVVTTSEIANAFANSMEYFNTTGGNPVSCAVGIAVLDVIKEEKLQENALKVGNYLKSELRKLMNTYPLIGNVRGLGLFIGIELVLDHQILTPAVDEAQYIINRMSDHGILISTEGQFNNVLKIKPPLVFSIENADLLVNTLDKILEEDFVRITK